MNNNNTNNLNYNNIFNGNNNVVAQNPVPIFGNNVPVNNPPAYTHIQGRPFYDGFSVPVGLGVQLFPERDNSVTTTYKVPIQEKPLLQRNATAHSKYMNGVRNLSDQESADFFNKFFLKPTAVKPSRNKHDICAKIRAELESQVFIEFAHYDRGAFKRPIYDFCCGSRAARAGLSHVHNNRPIYTTEDKCRTESFIRQSGHNPPSCDCKIGQCTHADDFAIYHSTDSIYYPGVLHEQLKQTISSSRSAYATAIFHVFHEGKTDINVAGKKYGSVNISKDRVTMTVDGNNGGYEHARVLKQLESHDICYFNYTINLPVPFLPKRFVFRATVLERVPMGASDYLLVRFDESVETLNEAITANLKQNLPINSDGFGNLTYIVKDDLQDLVNAMEETKERTNCNAEWLATRDKQDCILTHNGKLLSELDLHEMYNNSNGGMYYGEYESGQYAAYYLAQGKIFSSKLYQLDGYSYGDFSRLEYRESNDVALCSVSDLNSLIKTLLSFSTVDARSLVAASSKFISANMNTNVACIPLLLRAAAKYALWLTTSSTVFYYSEEISTLNKLKDNKYGVNRGFLPALKDIASRVFGTEYSVSQGGLNKC